MKDEQAVKLFRQMVDDLVGWHGNLPPGQAVQLIDDIMKHVPPLLKATTTEAFKDGYKTGVANSAKIKQLAELSTDEAYRHGAIDELKALNTYYLCHDGEGEHRLAAQFDERLAALQAQADEDSV